MVCLDCRLWFVNLLSCARVSGHRPKIQAKFEVERGGAGTRFPIPGALTLWTSIYLLESPHSAHLITRRIHTKENKLVPRLLELPVYHVGIRVSVHDYVNSWAQYGL